MLIGLDLDNYPEIIKLNIKQAELIKTTKGDELIEIVADPEYDDLIGLMDATLETRVIDLKSEKEIKGIVFFNESTELIIGIRDKRTIMELKKNEPFWTLKGKSFIL